MTTLIWSPRHPFWDVAAEVAEVAVGFAMFDDGLDGRFSPQFLLDLAVEAALLSAEFRGHLHYL
jgi:hypothetical protein